MARVKLLGIHRVKRIRADGRVEFEDYAWKGRGAPKLQGRRGSPEYVQSYMDAIAQWTRAPKKEETLSDLFDQYLASNYFRKKAKRTQKDYAIEIGETRVKFGALPLRLLGAQGVRRDFYDHREALARQRGDRKADKFWVTIGLIVAWGKGRGSCNHNPFEKGGRFYDGTRVDTIWPIEVEERFYEEGPWHLALGLLMGIWTGQRESDLIALTWFQYDGKFIRLEQQKTKRRITIPVGKPLREALERRRAEINPKPGDPILVTAKTGRAWKDANGFYSSFSKAMKKLKIEGLTFNDARGTAVTRLAMAGCSVPEIAPITGHSLKDVHAILDAHYLHRDPALAISAMAKLEAFWAARNVEGGGPRVAVEQQHKSAEILPLERADNPSERWHS